jgi:hypothetical protein
VHVLPVRSTLMEHIWTMRFYRSISQISVGQDVVLIVVVLSIPEVEWITLR